MTLHPSAHLSLPVIVPLLFGALLFVLPPAGRRRAGLFGALATSLVVLPLPMAVLKHGTLTQLMGGWSAPLGIELRADGLSALLMLFAALMGLAISLHAFAYFPHRMDGAKARTATLFWPLWMFNWGGLHAMLLSADLFNLYVTLEVISLSSVALVSLSGTADATRAALRYLFLALVGSLSYLLGIGLLYNAVGVLDLYQVAATVESTGLTRVGVGLMLAGLLIKCAVVPLHFWLPHAHAHAPAPVSAILSGLVITAAFYLLFRLWFHVLVPFALVDASTLMGVLGSAAHLWGGWLALKQERLKMVIAYSTVSQIGYLFLVFAMTTAQPESRSLAWAGAVFFAISHGLAKGAAFLAAGSLMQATGTDRIDELAGTARRYPAIAMTFALAGVSLMGLPPSGGFIGKWMLLKAMFVTGQWSFVMVMIVGGLLACAYIFRIFERFMAVPADDAPPVARVPLLQVAPGLVLAMAAIGLALFVAWPMTLISVDAPVTFTSFAPENLP